MHVPQPLLLGESRHTAQTFPFASETRWVNQPKPDSAQAVHLWGWYVSPLTSASVSKFLLQLPKKAGAPLLSRAKDGAIQLAMGARQGGAEI